MCAYVYKYTSNTYVRRYIYIHTYIYVCVCIDIVRMHVYPCYITLDLWGLGGRAIRDPPCPEDTVDCRGFRGVRLEPQTTEPGANRLNIGVYEFVYIYIYT